MTQARHSGNRRAWTAAAIVVAVCVTVTYAAFVRRTPLTRDYRVAAIFTTANQLRHGNPVRVAGIQVGEVTGVERGPGDTARVVMRLTDPGAVAEDATFAIEPRLLFEGNFYVKVSPRAAGTGQLPRGATVPLGRTTVPVQLDQVLDLLDLPARRALTQTIHAGAEGLHAGGTRSGAAELRTAVGELDGAVADVTRVARAAQGTGPGDLRRAVQGASATAAGLGANPAALASLVSDTRRVADVVRAHDVQLGAGTRALAALGRSGPANLGRVDQALPTVRRFARALTPALTRAPGNLTSARRLLTQVDRLTAPASLPALLRATAPVARDLPAAETRLTQTFGALTPAMRCVATNVVPALDLVVPDGALSTGVPAWQDLLHLGAALAGSSPDFDGNGTTIRLGVSGGSTSVTGALAGVGDVVGKFDATGVSPAWLGYGVDPPAHPEAPCASQPLPDLAARSPRAMTGWTARSTSGGSGTAAQDLMRALLLSGGDKRSALRATLFRLLGITAPKRSGGPAASPRRPAHLPAVPATPHPLPLPLPKTGPAAPVAAVAGKVTGAVDQTTQDALDALHRILGGGR